MTPEQAAQVVESLQRIQFGVSLAAAMLVLIMCMVASLASRDK